MKSKNGDLLFSFTDGAVNISKQAIQLLSNNDFKLKIVSVGELGFKNGATRNDIYQLAIKINLDLCPIAIIPLICMIIDKTGIIENLIIASEPIKGIDNDLKILILIKLKDQLWLDTHCGHLDHYYEPERQMVFCQKVND